VDAYRKKTHSKSERTTQILLLWQVEKESGLRDRDMQLMVSRNLHTENWNSQSKTTSQFS